MTLPRQLALDLPPLTSFSREDFLVSPSNEAAYAFIERWPDWPARRALLIGPKGSGKSHLAAIWSEMAMAATMPASLLDDAAVPGLVAHRAVAIEDAGTGIDETALFHLLNLVGETGSSLLITAHEPPDRWGLRLPDLISRLRAMTALTIATPDDDLFRMLLVKLFLDRQLIVDTSVVDFLVKRIERSFEAARQVVGVLDREGLSRGRRITRALAAELLKEVLAQTHESE
jgi:chromosomal replication initiation ATPase DnaA